MDKFFYVILIAIFLLDFYKSAPLSEEKNARIISYVNYQNKNNSYYYSFETTNGIVREERGDYVIVNNSNGEEVLALHVSGRYSYPDIDEITYEESYTADEFGFHIYGNYDGSQIEIQKPTKFIPSKNPNNRRRNGKKNISINEKINYDNVEIDSEDSESNTNIIRKETETDETTLVNRNLEKSQVRGKTTGYNTQIKSTSKETVNKEQNLKLNSVTSGNEVVNSDTQRSTISNSRKSSNRQKLYVNNENNENISSKSDSRSLILKDENSKIKTQKTNNKFELNVSENSLDDTSINRETNIINEKKLSNKRPSFRAKTEKPTTTTTTTTSPQPIDEDNDYEENESDSGSIGGFDPFGSLIKAAKDVSDEVVDEADSQRNSGSLFGAIG